MPDRSPARRCAGPPRWRGSGRGSPARRSRRLSRARSASSRSRRSTWRAPVTWRSIAAKRVAGEVVELAGDAPPLLGDRLLGERPARRVAVGRSAPCTLKIRRPMDEREGVGHHPRLPADVLLGSEPVADDPRRRPATAAIAAARAVDSHVCGDVEDHRHGEEQHRLEHLPAMPTTTKIGVDDDGGEQLRRQPLQPSWNTKASNRG